MFSRRRFLRTSTLAGAGMLLPWDKLLRSAYAQIPGGTLPPGDVTKYVLPLVKPPALPLSGTIPQKGGVKVDYYEMAVRQFTQRILSPPHPMTTVWSYASLKDPSTLNYPAFTFESRWNRPVRVKWINQLMDGSGNYLPHLLPIDPTLHWANPPGGKNGRDTRPTFDETPGPYTGPVPMITHVHGAHTTEDSDGYPEAWYLPNANNIPAGFARTGTFYDSFKKTSFLGKQWGPGKAVFQYPNDQRATTLWYHDHTLGMTRTNVYAGPAGFYLIRGGPDDQVVGTLPGPAPGVGDDPLGEYFEIPIAIQDRSFNTDGSLFYPDTREFFDSGEGWPGPYIPESLVPPIWQPEFFGNMIVVNGFTWPFLNVKRQRYRFRFLNGCNSRFLLLKLTKTPRMTNGSFNATDGTFWQIGAEGGFLPAAVPLDQLLMGPAERADVIVDFSQFQVGEDVYLVNDGPDAPFGGIGIDDLSDWESTGQVMKFHVEAGPAYDPSDHPSDLELPAITPLPNPVRTEQLSLNEEEDPMYPEAGPVAALLGTYTDGVPTSKMWSDDVTENPGVGDTEDWEIYNFTADAHPIHVHQVQFQVLNREALDNVDDDGVAVPDSFPVGAPRDPESWETGFKDTVIAYPGEVTRIRAKFDIPGTFVWHCHIVEHEDNEMMRPYRVGSGLPGA